MLLQKNYFTKRLNLLLKTPEERKNKEVNLSKFNREKIHSLKNKYQGERCFILGGSPSLNSLDLSKLNNEYTFTVNRGYMLKGKGLYHSTFHVISDTMTFKDEDSNGELLQGFSDFLFCYAGMQSPIVMENIYYIDYILDTLYGKTVFQDDITEPLVAYRSVIHFAIQIAYYLGFSKIYLLGVDIDFSKQRGHAYKETLGEKEREKSTSVVNAQKMLNGLKICTDWLKQHNVEIFNASPVGSVDCMPRIKYNKLFNKKIAC